MKWTKHLSELFMVTLGVLLAFALNSWWENRKESKQAQTQLDMIEREICDNYWTLQRSIGHHQTLLIEMDSCPLELRMILQGPRIQDANWSAVDLTVVQANIPAQQFIDLVKIYQTHEHLTRHGNTAGRLMSELNVMSPYYQLAVNKEDITPDMRKEFKTISRRSWRPIIQDWTYFQILLSQQIASYSTNYILDQ